MRNNPKYSGSIWRKWDLQVQTRLDDNYTILGTNTLTEDQLTLLTSTTGLSEKEITLQEKQMSPENYAKLLIGMLTLFSDIEVIGITDHNTGKELDYLIAEANTSQKVTVIPGVEVCSDQGIHILCLFDINKKWKENWEKSIEHFLTEIGISGTGFDNNHHPISSQKSCQDILDLVDSKGGICIFAHIGTDNGLFKNAATANGGTTHSDIYKHPLCQIVQIPHTSTLGIGTQNILEGRDPNYGNKKVTKIKCSDSRNLLEIGKNFIWVKADPTFEGLKQIIFEPDDRIKIQTDNPYNNRHKIFFESIELSGSTNFILPDFELPLNRELVTIIGGRGSGKSALLDTFAFFNEEHVKHDQNGKNKVIEYYRDNEGRSEPPPNFTLKTVIVDKDGNKATISKEFMDRNNLELPFLYLGQEQLSGIATNDFELTKIICKLIGIDISEASKESLVSKARSVLSDIENTQKQIKDITDRYVSLGYPNDIPIEDWVKNYLEKLKDQQTRLSSSETRDILQDINLKTQQVLKLEDFGFRLDALLVGMMGIEINDEIKNFNIDFKKLYPNATEIETLDYTKQESSIKAIQTNINSDIQSLKVLIAEQKDILISRGIKEDINSLLQASENLLRQIGGIEKDLENYKESQSKIESLNREKSVILSEINTMLERLRDSITTAYSSFQSSREDSTQEEKDLFKKIIQGITVEGQIEFNQKAFLKKALNDFFDNRRISNETELKKLIAGENPNGTAKDITFDNLSTWIQSDLSREKCFSTRGLNNIIEYIFTQWATFLKVKAVAKLNGKPTEILSIGQRGTLLLKVYLATSTAKQVFIIDQPEDNLDNSFIMDELVPLIRKAKLSRQIIISTHNANLVVNADAEQVIVAQLDHGSDYICGSIENPLINKNIRDILEGGEAAFRQRERKYLN